MKTTLGGNGEKAFWNISFWNVLHYAKQQSMKVVYSLPLLPTFDDNCCGTEIRKVELKKEKKKN